MPIQILQSTLDLMICYNLVTLGPQHAYGIGYRLQQVSADALTLNQDIKAVSSGEAMYYTIARAGLKALNQETERWRQLAGVLEKLLAEEQ
jgi:PadR family transcriptional regulator PadR